MGEAGEGTRHEWIYCVSDEPLVPVLLACRLETEPSILFCPLHRVANVGELAERVGNTLETSEGSRPYRGETLGCGGTPSGSCFQSQCWMTLREKPKPLPQADLQRPSGRPDGSSCLRRRWPSRHQHQRRRRSRRRSPSQWPVGRNRRQRWPSAQVPKLRRGPDHPNCGAGWRLQSPQPGVRGPELPPHGPIATGPESEARRLPTAGGQVAHGTGVTPGKVPESGESA